VCAKKYEFIVELKGGYNWKKTWKNTLCYFNRNFLKRHLKRNGGSITYAPILIVKEGETQATLYIW